jgi:hypothetical protein
MLGLVDNLSLNRLSRTQFRQLLKSLIAEKRSLMKLGVHYHIRWSSDSCLDWKPFRTKHEATKVAEGIKKPNESYDLLERDDECERCKDFRPGFRMR